MQTEGPTILCIRWTSSGMRGIQGELNIVTIMINGMQGIGARQGEDKSIITV